MLSCFHEHSSSGRPTMIEARRQDAAQGPLLWRLTLCPISPFPLWSLAGDPHWAGSWGLATKPGQNRHSLMCSSHSLLVVMFLGWLVVVTGEVVMTENIFKYSWMSCHGHCGICGHFAFRFGLFTETLGLYKGQRLPHPLCPLSLRTPLFMLWCVSCLPTARWSVSFGLFIMDNVVIQMGQMGHGLSRLI